MTGVPPSDTSPGNQGSCSSGATSGCWKRNCPAASADCTTADATSAATNTVRDTWSEREPNHASARMAS